MYAYEITPQKYIQLILGIILVELCNNLTGILNPYLAFDLMMGI